MVDYKKITYLVSQSYKKDGSLDVEKIHAIISLLGRTNLKKYINALRRTENEKNVIIMTPSGEGDKEMFEKIFPERKIIYKNDPSLMVGIKIIDNDIMYELNLRDTLNDIINHIDKTYD